MAFGENTVNDVVTGYGLTEAAVWWLIEEGGGGDAYRICTDPVVSFPN